ncbi:lasso peptide biosynthesis PqqD family chaperone [Neobacillus mesonae]|uniref:lasso peptide biosynthesis PqqD family chaperone n=1 Tax=Neobacillus mesonae TaxID=1193713 RepID=UPI00203E2C58|nr:lasso peptide biosynthesis PqqD family chaperone [Neobacillus mesonae]MCM3568203.1 lasso peptide biosynthesis PqqD family chaperone [Neobacillus mesonae]
MLKVQNISYNSIISQSQGNIAADMDGEKVLMSIKNSKYYNLGEIGGEIWSLISKPKSIKEVIDHLTSEYNVGHDDCEQQVITFLKELKKEGLVIIE